MPQGVSRPLLPEEQKAIFSACDDDFLGLRTRIVLELSMRFGLLEKEIHDLNLSHVISCGAPRSSIEIHETKIATDRQFRSILGRYLITRSNFVDDLASMIQPESPLILSLSLTRLTQRALRKSLKIVAAAAEIDRLTFHTLRATFIRNLWEQTKDAKEVARRGRLKSPATVMRHIGETQS